MAGLITITKAYSSAQPRDEDGKWTSGSGKAPRSFRQGGFGSPLGEEDSTIDSWVKDGIDQGSLTDADKAALADYQYGDFANLNAGLRSGKISGFEDRIDALDQAIEVGTLTKPAVVYRGVSMDQKTANRLFKERSTLLDQGYMSTTLKKSVSEDFSDSVGPISGTIKIQVPKGTSVAYFRDYDGYPHHELVLPRGQNYIINRVVKNGNSWDISATLEPHQ